MNRLTALINLGSVPEIRLLLSHELTEAGLAEYLANLPPDLGEIWVETMEVTGSELGSPFAVVFRTESGARFSALLGWQEESGQLKRSEEHTSELQSRPHLVCRLLLEKKKN